MRRTLGSVLATAMVLGGVAQATEAGKACRPVQSAAERGDPRVRAAAQRGLDYLAQASQAWTRGQQACFGCHVHATTLEGLVIGRRNQYRVSSDDMALMINRIKSPTNGIHTTTFTTARAFGGAALGRYDRWIDGTQTNDLLQVARKLIESQQQDGSVKVDDTRFPVESGVMQATYQAMQTWRQAYARSADDVWLTPIRRAEQYIQATASSWKEAPAGLQDLNYAMMGLAAAGMGADEKVLARLARFAVGQQHQDGGWGFRPESDAFATGQSLTALRTIGRDEKDSPVERGIGWLVAHQQQDGGWGGAVSTQGNSKLGEAMWAVLGLVSVDVLTVAVHGIGDGEHVDGVVAIDAQAKDNQSGGVAQMDLFVDDRPVQTSCGAALGYRWDTRQLSDGKHVVDVIATNAKGQRSTRRFEVYAGKFWLTQVGSRFDEPSQKSQITLRNLAPSGKVRLEVFTLDGNAHADKKAWESDRAVAPGAMTLEWDGKGSDGKARPRGRYLARLTYLDAAGAPVQKEETMFFHDREEAQKAQFGAISGSLSLRAANGAGVAANTEVELVDKKGNVVQRVRTTEQGRYLFKNVDSGEYKVRTRKDGWADQEQSVKSAPAAAPTEANFHL